MDYIKLKKTLIAVFDHFLSCHDMNDLEEMMQAFEAGKSLVITLPEAVHREEYAADVARMLEVLQPKKIVSTIRKKKPHKLSHADIKEIKICDVPVLLDVTKLSKEKRYILKEALQGEHKVTFSDIMMGALHGFAKACICKEVKGRKDNASCEMLHCAQHDKSIFYERFLDDEHKRFEKIEKSSRDYRKDIVRNVILEVKKHKDPP